MSLEAIDGRQREGLSLTNISTKLDDIIERGSSDEGQNGILIAFFVYGNSAGCSLEGCVVRKDGAFFINEEAIGGMKQLSAGIITDEIQLGLTGFLQPFGLGRGAQCEKAK